MRTAKKTAVKSNAAKSEDKSDSLSTYNAKRRFEETPEPRGRVATKQAGRGDSFVVQRHWATRDHYDFRLELDGVLKSWAVTRGPSAKPGTRRLAVRTEDHPVDYGGFEGTIPEKHYGAGTVMLWDRGTWRSVDKDPAKAIEKGSLKFALEGERMKGEWALVRMKTEGSLENWLLLKHRDEFAEEDDSLAERHIESVESGRSREEIAKGTAVWDSKVSKSERMAKAFPRKEAKAADKTVPKRLEFIPPQLCDTREKPPLGDAWVYEMKYDGYRLQLHIDDGAVRIFTCNGLDWTEKFADLAQAAARLNVEQAIIDGEAVILDKNGISDFHALVTALKSGSAKVVFEAFDLLTHEGEDLRKLTLRVRKQRLQKVLKGGSPQIQYATDLSGDGEKIFTEACAAGAEGIIAKKADAPYQSGRQTSWVKVKGDSRADVFIVGWRPSDRDRPFASLLAATDREGTLRFAGGIGTGFSIAEQKKILQQLKPHELKSPPRGLEGAALAISGVHWTAPVYEAEVRMTGWTPDGQIRHPRYLAMKPATKKPLHKIGAAKPSKAEKASAEPAISKTRARKKTQAHDIQVTHPERVIYPGEGITKGDLAAYYVAVADKMEPHIHDRLMSVIRAPEGIEGETFFQRHPMKGMGPGIVPSKLKDKTYFIVNGSEGLLNAVQFGVVEFHGWGSRIDKPDYPDRMIFDLDPDESVPFAKVKEVAVMFRDVLKAAGLESFPLMSGGKGVHVVAPLDRSQTWEVVEGFAKGLAHKMAALDPDNLVALQTKARRKGRIYVDWMRNKLSSTAIMPYSLRARPGAPVAMPVSWEQLKRVRSANQFKMAQAKRAPAAWPDFDEKRGALSKQALKALK